MRWLGIFGAVLWLAACASATPGPAAGVCSDIGSMVPAAVAALDGQPATSAVGVLWADVKAGCATAASVSASPDWTGMVWGELKALIPQVLPTLLPLLIGLL